VDGNPVGSRTPGPGRRIVAVFFLSAESSDALRWCIRKHRSASLSVLFSMTGEVA